jgi:hypothetical protein
MSEKISTAQWAEWRTRERQVWTLDAYEMDGDHGCPGERDLVCFTVDGCEWWGVVQGTTPGGSYDVDYGPVRTLVRLRPQDILAWRPRRVLARSDAEAEASRQREYQRDLRYRRKAARR